MAHTLASCRVGNDSEVKRPPDVGATDVLFRYDSLHTVLWGINTFHGTHNVRGTRGMHVRQRFLRARKSAGCQPVNIGASPLYLISSRQMTCLVQLKRPTGDAQPYTRRPDP